jgi:hypothetical protein
MVRAYAIVLVGTLLPACVVAGGVQTLTPVEVVGEADELSGVADSATVGTVTAEQIENRPLLRPGELLEVVPGLIVTQHSGDGKANQYFLRGFNLDHGTDIAISANGVPVNMPSHAHGQGYADINFLIPELVERIQYRKGPYYAEEGNFASAGTVNIDYVNRLDKGLAQVEAGENGYRRAVVAGSPPVGTGNLLLGLEWMRNDGPWDVPEDLRKANGVLRYNLGDARNGLTFTATAYDADWTATDQIAGRAVERGLIGRFGSLDPTDGGSTRRNSLAAEWRHTFGDGGARVLAYLVDYELQLFSNFTYFLDDPVNGDQFEQSEERLVSGLRASYRWPANWGGFEVENLVGLDLRRDDINGVGLFRTRERQRLSTVRQDDVRETALGVYAQTSAQWTEHLRSAVGVRADRLDCNVASNFPANSGDADDTLLSPKLSLIFGPWARTEYFVNLGRGFHSNDCRGATITTDPSTGEPAAPVEPLVPAKGVDLGLRSAYFRNTQIALALWRLNLDSELLFLGDAGITEPSRPSRRTGMELAVYHRPYAWLILDADLAYSRARFTDDDPVGDRIPGAIEGVASVGMTMDRPQGWIGGARLRYFGPRPLIEDDSVRSDATTLINLEVGYRFGRGVSAGIEVFNVLDAKDDDIAYFYESRLQDEAEPVADIHFHPVEPRTVRLKLSVRF